MYYGVLASVGNNPKVDFTVEFEYLLDFHDYDKISFKILKRNEMKETFKGRYVLRKNSY